MHCVLCAEETCRRIGQFPNDTFRKTKSKTLSLDFMSLYLGVSTETTKTCQWLFTLSTARLWRRPQTLAGGTSRFERTWMRSGVCLILVGGATLTASPVMPHSQQAAEQFCGIDSTSCWPASMTWTLKWSCIKKCPKPWIMHFLSAPRGPTSWERRGSGGGPTNQGLVVFSRWDENLHYFSIFTISPLILLSSGFKCPSSFSTGVFPLLTFLECRDQIDVELRRKCDVNLAESIMCKLCRSFLSQWRHCNSSCPV